MRLFWALLYTPVLCFAWHGGVDVKGQLKCKGNPYSGESVQVWEQKFIGHEVWYKDWTDSSGNFSIKATGHEHGFAFSVYPYLWIPNYCGTAKVDGYRCTKNLIQIKIPIEFVSYSDHPRVFNIGVIELEDIEEKHFNIIEHFFGYDRECRSY
ncbi:unnamed protein product [Caenorhabditis brenneri]